MSEQLLQLLLPIYSLRRELISVFVPPAKPHLTMRAHPRQIIQAVIGVVGDDEGARLEPALDQVEDLRIERHGVVEHPGMTRSFHLG